MLALHALLLFGLPHLRSATRAGDGGTRFITRMVAPPTPTPVAAEPKPSPAPAPAVAPRPRPPRPKPAPAPERAAAAQPEAAPVEPVQPPTPTQPTDGSPALARGTTGPEISLLEAPPLAQFGGKQAPEAIKPPLPGADAETALQFARGAGDAPVQVPPAAELTYRTAGRLGGQTVAIETTLDWRQDGRSYEGRWVLFTPRAGEHTRTATGLLSPQGLVPVHAALRTPDAQDMRLDYGGQRVFYGAPGVVAPLQAGAQDRLSVLLQLGALLAGDAKRYTVGSTIELPAVHAHGPGTWRFAIAVEEPVTSPRGLTVSAVKLVHQPENDQDARIELWLARNLHYLPVRVRITEPNGDTVEHQLMTAYTQQIPGTPAQTR